MNKDEILKVAQTEKLDEGRKYINDFALGTTIYEKNVWVCSFCLQQNVGRA